MSPRGHSGDVSTLGAVLRRARAVVPLLLGLPILLAPGTASAATKPPARIVHKSIWGPLVTGNLLTLFPRYHRLGVDLYQLRMRWDDVAKTRPARPRDPKDPAYAWSEDVDYAVSEGAEAKVDVAVTLLGTPPWANGNRPSSIPPDRVKDFADFVTAASKRYPGVTAWRIWDDTNAGTTWQSAQQTYDAPLTDAEQAPARQYARLLDAAYVAVKRADPKDLVIGGNTTSVGRVFPRNWIKWMVLSNGKPPRMDVLGHSPYGARAPMGADAAPPSGAGQADFADLAALARWSDLYLTRPRGLGPLPIFVAKWFIPAGPNDQFPFYTSVDGQAEQIRRAFRLARSWDRIWGIGWEVWQDEARRPGVANPLTGGLLDARSQIKPAYRAFRDG